MGYYWGFLADEESWTLRFPYWDPEEYWEGRAYHEPYTPYRTNPGCIGLNPQTGEGGETGEMQYDFSPYADEEYIGLWYRFVPDGVSTRQAGLWVIIIYSDDSTEGWWDSDPGADLEYDLALGDSGWLYFQYDFVRKGILTVKSIIIGSDPNGLNGSDFTVFVDDVQLGDIPVVSAPGYYKGDTTTGGVWTSDLPFALATPDDHAISPVALLALGSGEPALDDMVVASGTGEVWGGIDDDIGSIFSTRITSLRWLPPCATNYGVPTGGIAIPTNTGEVIYIPAGQPGQVLVTGEPGEPPQWIDNPAGGVTDHGALTGLTPDDDHPHYWNDARGDQKISDHAGDDDAHHTWPVTWDLIEDKPEIVPDAWFLHSEDSADIGGYKIIDREPTVTPPEIERQTVTNLASSPVLIMAYATPLGRPDLALLPGGEWITITWANVDNIAGDTEIVIELYKRNLAGDETLLFSTSTGLIDVTDPTKYRINSVQEDFILLDTDRIVAKYWAVTTAVPDITVSLYYEGSDHYSRIHPAGAGGLGSHTHGLIDITDEGALAALDEITVSLIDAEASTAGQVMESDGAGGVDWATRPPRIWPSYNEMRDDTGAVAATFADLITAITALGNFRYGYCGNGGFACENQTLPQARFLRGVSEGENSSTLICSTAATALTMAQNSRLSQIGVINAGTGAKTAIAITGQGAQLQRCRVQAITASANDAICIYVNSQANTMVNVDADAVSIGGAMYSIYITPGNSITVKGGTFASDVYVGAGATLELEEMPRIKGTVVNDGTIIGAYINDDGEIVMLVNNLILNSNAINEILQSTTVDETSTDAQLPSAATMQTTLTTYTVHLPTAGQYAGLDEKTSLAGADLILIEDSEDSGGKKYVQIDNLPAGSGGGTQVWPATSELRNSDGDDYATFALLAASLAGKIGYVGRAAFLCDDVALPQYAVVQGVHHSHRVDATDYALSTIYSDAGVNTCLALDNGSNTVRDLGVRCLNATSGVTYGIDVNSSGNLIDNVDVSAYAPGGDVAYGVFIRTGTADQVLQNATSRANSSGSNYPLYIEGSCTGIEINGGHFIGDVVILADSTVLLRGPKITGTPTFGNGVNGYYIDNSDGAHIVSAGVTKAIHAEAVTGATGLIELATQAEVNTGTDMTRAVTPNTLSGYVGNHIVGEIKIWTNATAPTGWILCAGTAINRTTYAALFAVIGTSYGAGNGSTTFNIPDLRGRVPLGRDNMVSSANRVTAAAADSLGGASGQEDDQITITSMPYHRHSATLYRLSGDGNRFASSSGGDTYSANTTYVGADGLHNNMQPYQTFTYIIYHGVGI